MGRLRPRKGLPANKGRSWDFNLGFSDSKTKLFASLSVHEGRDLVSLTLGKFPKPHSHLTGSRCLINACGRTEGSEAAFSAGVKVELNSGPKMTVSHDLEDHYGSI